MLPNPPEDTAGGGRSTESLPFNYSAARASCCPCWSQRKALARAPRLGLAGVVKVWFQDRQAACASGCWHHSLGLGHSALGASPALPIRAALGLAVPGQGLELSFSLQSLCYGTEVLALTKFPKPRWGAGAGKGRRASSLTTGESPGGFAGPWVLGILSRPHAVSDTGHSALTKNTLVHAVPSAWNALALPFILQDSAQASPSP